MDAVEREDRDRLSGMDILEWGAVRCRGYGRGRCKATGELDVQPWGEYIHKTYLLLGHTADVLENRATE